MRSFPSGCVVVSFSVRMSEYNVVIENIFSIHSSAPAHVEFSMYYKSRQDFIVHIERTTRNAPHTFTRFTHVL